MAIRSNIGNQVTNAMQIISVGTTTAAARLGHAEDSLINRSLKERKKIELDEYNTNKAYEKMLEEKEGLKGIEDQFKSEANTNESSFIDDKVNDDIIRLANRGYRSIIDEELEDSFPDVGKIFKEKKTKGEI